MKLTFWGAAQQVTGSMYVLTLNEGRYKVLIDCGADFDNKSHKKTFTEFPFRVQEIDVVLLTHAHIDHTGNVTELIKAGYQGQFLCTSPTLEISALLLKDNQLLKSNNKEKDYAIALVNRAIDRFVPVKAQHDFKVNDFLSIQFIPTGHLLGACNIYLKIQDEGQCKTMVFSGDLGRKNYPLLADPVPCPSADYVICESTYGGRYHQEKQKPEDILKQVIIETCVSKRGRLIIPAFSIGRTQSLLFTLHDMFLKGLIPKVKIFTDSSLSMRGSAVYEKYVNWLNADAQRIYKETGSLFDFDHVNYVKSYKESKMISNYYEPCIIISSSGMIAGGRINEHVKANLQNSHCTILMIGYSAEGTMGHELMKGNPTIMLKRRRVPIAAQIKYTDMFSGHADQEGLLDFVKQFDVQQLKQLFLVHGEKSSMTAFQEILQKELNITACMPQKGEEFEL